MKKCPQCEHENPQNARFCNNCGNKLADIQEQSGEKAISGPKDEPAERRQLTALFCDLIGSTSLSEQLDPEEYRKIILDYHQLAEEVIQQYGGYVGNYLGDGLLIYFGYPRGLEDAPRAAIRSGLHILRTLEKANGRWTKEGRPEVQVRIGIHTGLAVVDDRLALGDTINIASRLEGLADTNRIVVSRQTKNLAEGWFDFKNIGFHTLKGISEPMEVFEVLGQTSMQTRLEVAKRKGLSPLVGRENEVRKLEKLLQSSLDGKGSTVLVHGEAGIGKSRLVDHLKAHILENEDMEVLEARSSAYHQNSAFYPLIKLFENKIFGFRPEVHVEEKIKQLESYLTDHGTGDADTLALIAEFLSIQSENLPPLLLSPIAKKEKLKEKLTDVLFQRSEQQPLLFILEDLHWADPSTLEWFQTSMQKITDRRVLIICTSRPEFNPPWEENEDHIFIRLERLSSDHMLKICHHYSNGKALPEEIISQISTKTEGIPLFVEELTKMILESGLLEEKAAEYVLSKTFNTIEIPSTLQDSLLARLDRLAGTKNIVQVGSVLGREFSAEMLDAVLPLNLDRVGEGLKKLIDSDIFQPLQKGNQETYQFKHALIRDTAYHSMLKSQRKNLHHHVAKIMESDFPDISKKQPEILAHHYTEAQEFEMSLPLWLQAGQVATQKNANLEAIAHLEKGISLLPEIQDEKIRISLELDFRLTLGGAFVVAYGFPHPKVGETFNKARELARHIEISPKLALILMNLLSYYFNTEDYESNKELTEYTFQLASHPDYGYWFELVGNQVGLSGGVSIIQGDFANANKSIERILEIFDPSLPFPWELAPSGYLEVGAKAWWMIDLWVIGDIEKAVEVFEHHLDYASDHSDSMTLYHIHTFPALFCLESRQWNKAAVIIGDYLPVVKEFGDPVFILTAEIYHAIAKAFQGDRKDLEKAQELLNMCFTIGFSAFAVVTSTWVGELYYQFGEYETALKWNNKILDHVNQTGSHIHTSDLYRTRGLIKEALGMDKTEVEKDLIKARHIAREQQARLYELRATYNLAKWWKDQGKTEKGRHLLEEIYTWFDADYEYEDFKLAKQLLQEID